MKRRTWSIAVALLVALLANSFWWPAPVVPRAVASTATSAFDAVTPARVASLRQITQALYAGGGADRRNV